MGAERVCAIIWAWGFASVLEVKGRMCNAHSTIPFSRSFSLTAENVSFSTHLHPLTDARMGENCTDNQCITKPHSQWFLWHQISWDVLLFWKPALTPPPAQSTISASFYTVSPLLFCQHWSPLRTLSSTLRKWATTIAHSSTTHYKHTWLFLEKTFYNVRTTYIWTYSICVFCFPK